jgi:tRNA(fMet)-specific endonuclease VapC
LFCLDTNIVIFALNRRKPEIAARLSSELRAGSTLIVPSIVRFELEYGIAKSSKPAQSREALETLLASGFEQAAFDGADARHAADIRVGVQALGLPIGPYDVLIAAQARRRGAVLVTLNSREFERVPGLMVADWAR